MQQGALRVPLLTAQAAAQASLPVNVRSYPNVTIFLQGSGTTSSGAVTIEEADYDENTGQIPTNWSAIGSAVAATTFTAGAQVATHLPTGQSYGYIRVRISTVIGGGGTVTATLRAD